MILASHGIIGSSIGQVDADYQAILAYATTAEYTLPSASQRIKQNQLMLDLKAAGVWTKLDTLAIFATDGNSDFALIDWKKLSQYTAVNSPTFTTNQGFTGNGTSSYINTNFNPAIGTNNYILNDASRCAWVFTAASNRIIDGISSGSQNDMTTQVNNQQRINSGTTALSVSADLSGTGFKSIHRTSSTNVSVFNNTTQTNGTATSTSITSENQFILRRGSTHSAHQVSLYGMGASLVSENTAFYNAINTYLTSL